MIRLYHGTNMLFDAPDLTLCQPYKDFGRGFYLTPDLAVLFRRFEAGLVTIGNLIEELKFKKVALQYSFHTVNGLGLLTFKEAKRV